MAPGPGASVGTARVRLVIRTIVKSVDRLQEALSAKRMRVAHHFLGSEVGIRGQQIGLTFGRLRMKPSDFLLVLRGAIQYNAH